MMHEKQQRVLDFWFGEDPLKEADRAEQWFTKDPAFDAEIRSRFFDMMVDAASGAFDDWAKTPRGALALMILLDQFPRNVFRGESDAFATDAHARRLAEIAIDHGLDQKLNVIERCFLYLPLEHSEDLAAQDRSVELFTKLRDEALPEEKEMIEEAIDYALRHREVIQKFGRFPHRNEILNRSSTADEKAFLKTPNSSF